MTAQLSRPMQFANAWGKELMIYFNAMPIDVVDVIESMMFYVKWPLCLGNETAIHETDPWPCFNIR